MTFKLLTYIALVLFCLFSFGYTPASRVLDLRGYDWAEKDFMDLNTSWHYADSCMSSDCNEWITLDISKTRVDQLGYPAFGYGTYVLNVLVDHHEHLMLKIPDYFSAYEVYVNDQLLASVGRPGVDKSTTTPGRKMLYLPLHQLASDTLQLRIPIANFTHHKRGIGNHPIKIGLEKQMLHQKFLDDSYDTFLTGFLILATFFFLGLFFHGKQDFAILFFALFTLAYAYRIVGWHNYVLHDLIALPYQLGIRLEYSTFYLCGAFFAMYLEYLFPNEAPSKITRMFALLSLAWVLSTLMPIYLFTQLNTYYLYLLLLGMMMLVGIIIRAALRKRPDAMFSLYSVLGVLLVFSLKTLDYLNIVEEHRGISIAGELTFFVFQALILSRNFTENWRQAKKDAEKLAHAKSDFLSVMSHEIRTPLNAVIGTTYHLMDSGPKPEQLSDLEHLKSAADNLLALINNVLDYNKIDSNKLNLDFDPVRLKAFCETQTRILEPLAAKKNLKLNLKYDESLYSVVSIDKVRLGQVLTNLIGNAIKFTKNGGVTLEVTKVIETNTQSSILFAVTDTGEGIPQSDLIKIFGAFEQANNTITRQYGGAGLGLAISQKLVELMGSSIKIQSEVGKGSVFSFKIVCDHEAEKETFLDELGTSHFENTNILLVEDNPMNVLIAKRQLEKWKISVTVAESGGEAIDMVSKGVFQLVLMDLQMPVMDGFEATAIIRAAGYEQPIIALTAASVSANELKTKGFDDILTKPFSPAGLEEKLNQFL